MSPPPFWLTLASGIIIGVGIAYFLGKSETVESVDLLINQPSTKIDCPNSIKVYPYKKSKVIARLPKKVRRDPNLHLTASTRIEEDGHSHVVSAVYAKHDGTVRLFDYQEPLKLFSKPRERYTLEYAYGASDIETTWQGTLKINLLNIKKLKIGVLGNARGDGSHFTGLGLSYSW